jgi:hypothetical protein
MTFMATMPMPSSWALLPIVTRPAHSSYYVPQYIFTTWGLGTPTGLGGREIHDLPAEKTGTGAESAKSG